MAANVKSDVGLKSECFGKYFDKKEVVCSELCDLAHLCANETLRYLKLLRKKNEEEIEMAKKSKKNEEVVDEVDDDTKEETKPAKKAEKEAAEAAAKLAAAEKHIII